jgi:hypothetical protein
MPVMKASPSRHRANAAAFGARLQSEPIDHNPPRRNPISSKKQPVVVRKASKKIADSRRVRFGSGSAPRVLRTVDTATHDSGKVRFGSGSAPASLRK